MASKEDVIRAANAPVIEGTQQTADPAGTPGTETLPPAGYSRGEVLRMRHDKLQELIDQRGEQMAFGLLDPKQLEIDPEIARHYADILAVSRPQPDRMYCWVETGKFGTHPEHVHHKQMQGYQFVGPEDQECPNVPRSPEGYRKLGTCLLMWVALERYVNIRAAEHAAALKQRGSLQNADEMLAMAARHGASVNVIENWGQLSDESRRLAEQRFVQRQRVLTISRDRIDRELRQGTAHLNYGNQRPAHI